MSPKTNMPSKSAILMRLVRGLIKLAPGELPPTCAFVWSSRLPASAMAMSVVRQWPEHHVGAQPEVGASGALLIGDCRVRVW